MSMHWSKVQALSKLEFEQVAAPTMRQVFKSSDPYDEPFAPKMTERLILCEFMDELQPPLIGPLIDVAREFGDQGFFVSLIIDVGDAMPHHWYVPFDDIDAYPAIFKWHFENVTFSPNSVWGIITTPDEFAILGAESAFLARLKERLPGIEEQTEEFMIRRKREAELGFRNAWIPRVLEHVHGKEKANTYLHAYGLD